MSFDVRVRSKKQVAQEDLLGAEEVLNEIRRWVQTYAGQDLMGTGADEFAPTEEEARLMLDQVITMPVVPEGSAGPRRKPDKPSFAATTTINVEVIEQNPAPIPPRGRPRVIEPEIVVDPVSAKK